MSDAELAGIARTLAQALHVAAYERNDAAKKEVARLHTELCAAWHREELEAMHAATTKE